MKVFVTGVNGQLGHDVMNELHKRGYYAIGSDIAPKTELDFPYVSMDITNENLVKKTIERIKPDVVCHCAAWTAVDAAEEDENKPKVYKINVLGTKYIAEACKNIDAKMVYISTDYVFNGKGNKPWNPDDKNYAPLNYYGETKLLGEQTVSNILKKYFIVRIAWVFGKNGNNFIKTMLRVGKDHDILKVVDDQIGTPTYTFDLSKLLVDMIETDKYGYYHATNEGGYISWYEFAKTIFEEANYSTKVIPVTTIEYGLSKAKRPYNSRLDKSKLKENGFDLLPNWEDALKRYLKEINY